jgi:DNA-binding response OmpR family regulator
MEKEISDDEDLKLVNHYRNKLSKPRISGEVSALFVVRDAEEIKSFARELLLDGIMTNVVGNEQEASQFLLYDPNYSIVLLDTELKKETGFEFLENIKKDKKIWPRPIVMFTDDDTDEAREKAKELGAVDYIVKTGLTPQQIANNIKEILSKIKSNNIVE